MQGLIVDENVCLCRQRRKPAYAGFLAADLRVFALCALDLPGLHAARADVSLAHMAVLVADGDLLDVGLEPTVCDAVRMADVTACRRLLTADLANLRHVINSV